MTTKPKYQMLPYRREDRDIYAGLEFNPDEKPERPEALYQEQPLHEFNYLLNYYLATATGRRDVLVTGACFLCYDRNNLNVRVEPDCLVAFGVDAAAIRDRRLYLPWEAGKMADFVLEMASQSTARNDLGPKRLLYERLGIGEYWRFDATGGGLYGEPLAGERLVDGRYRPIGLTRQDDGSIRGYSTAIDAFLSWEPREEGQHRGWLHIYDPATGLRLESYENVMAARRAAEARATTVVEQAIAAQEQTVAAEERASAALREVAAAHERTADAEERAVAALRQAIAAQQQAVSSQERADAAEAEAERLREVLRRLRG